MWRPIYSVTAFSHHPAPPTVLLPKPQTASRPWATTTRKHVEKVNFNRRNQISWPVTLHSHSKDGRSDRIVTMRWITSNMWQTHHVYLVMMKIVNTFQFQQATIFTATLLFQPQLFTTLYIQLQMIIYKSSVCCFTHMHKDIISYTTVVRCKKSSEAPITTKGQYFIEPFLIRSVRCKHKHFWRWFLSSPLVLSRLTTAVVSFLSGSGSRYAIKFLIWGCITSILAPNITTRWYFKLLM